MKKKGLIIATIVMVLVLAVSLTTATYAWFTAASVTSIEGFNVSVASNNNVNIGFLANYANVMSSTPVASQYVTGTVTYTRGATDGVLGGTWEGTSGLSSAVEHDILWGAQSKAVAAQKSTEAIETASTTKGDYQSVATVLAGNVAGTSGYAYYSINAANEGENNALSDATKAQANYKDREAQTDAAKNGDYVHIVLGAQPNKTLTVNELCIAVDYSAQQGANLGVLTAIHIAYRVSKNGAAASAWADLELFGTSNHYTRDTSGSAATGVATNITDDYADAYVETYGGTVPAKSYMTKINNLSLTQGYIDQIELVIYIDGTDSDCNNSAINNISGALKLFFLTEAAD